MSPASGTPLLIAPHAAIADVTPAAETPAACPFLAMSAPPLPSKEAFPGYWFEGASEFERAERMHKLTGTPLLIYFFVDWCPFCHDLERNLLDEADVDRHLRGTAIRARVNPEAGDEERRLAARFGVVGFPTLFYVLPGEQPRRLSPRISEGGKSRLMSGAEFIEKMAERVAVFVRRRLHEADERFRAGDPSAAIDVLDKIAALRPEEPRIYLGRAAAHFARGDRERAIEDLRRAYDLSSDEIRTFLQADAMLASENRWNEIASCWSAYIEAHPDDAKAYLERGGALSRKGDREGARRDAETSCRLGEQRACGIISSLGS